MILHSDHYISGCDLRCKSASSSRKNRKALYKLKFIYHLPSIPVAGCDSGFGHALAKRLSDEGLQVFAGVLDVNGGGAQQLRERGSEKLKVLQLDVTDSSQIETVHRFVGLVNNLHPITWYSRCMDVNFLSAVRMCQVFLPLLRRSRGRIVNVTSMAGEVPLPMFSSYGASKPPSACSPGAEDGNVCVGRQSDFNQPGGFRKVGVSSLEDVSQFTDEVLAAVSPEAREDYGKMYISSSPASVQNVQQSSEDLSSGGGHAHALLSVHPRPLYTPGQMAWLLRSCTAAARCRVGVPHQETLSKIKNISDTTRSLTAADSDVIVVAQLTRAALQRLRINNNGK
uniref:Uncharacterized protein n=1 Tax=Labrus bergylta TaxID=56723 RepID=A0A3Q3ECE6_9LABR